MLKELVADLPLKATGYAIMTIPNDERGAEHYRKLSRAVSAYNRTVPKGEQLYVRRRGRLGKKNPAYEGYRRNYSYVLLKDATRFDVYVLTKDPDCFSVYTRERLEHVHKLLGIRA